jgi:predicted DNA-binding transcriptional regulator AlpA
MDGKKLLAAKNVADILQLTSRQVVRLANRGVIPSVELPTGDRRFIESDIWDWIEQQRHQTEAGRVAP